MHVLFVSACEKRAIKKTRVVLDSFALRTGEKAWASPMTEEGLREVRAALKRVATRQTAVACYRNEGRLRMKLLWIVGSRNAFGADGHFPAGYRLAKSSKPAPDWLRVASLLAQAAGWAHDFGKASQMFQAKLSAEGPLKDSVRHEWVSMRLLQLQRSGKTWEEAWQILKSAKSLESNTLEKGLNSVADVLDYLVVTHHRLFGPKEKMTEPDLTNHFSIGKTINLAPQARLSNKPFEAVQNLLTRIEKLTPEKTPSYWRAIAIFTRAALIMADHVVSARAYGKVSNAGLFANTKSGKLDQPLEWHLGEVSHAAADFAYRFGSLRLPGLSEQTVELICRAAGNARFQWQDRAAEALTAFRQRSSLPVLALNMAATGSGKTRMNARAACALAQGPVRFAVALNLRTLTLQTGDAYRQQLHLGDDELACIIGDRVTLKLHQQNRAANPDDADDNEAETEFDVSPGEFEIPAWLEEFAANKRNFKTITGAPILISIIDFLIAAGMPHKQGHHVAALLRLADSDLVLDEVDGYDPKPLVAVLRLVQIAALFGRNVICSTATLAEPVAQAIYQAYLSGAELRGALQANQPAFACALFDDALSPQLFEYKSGSDFSTLYQAHIHKQHSASSTQKSERIPYLQTVQDKTPEAWQEAVLTAIRRLHGDHGWRHNGSGKRISFGLVRMANIVQAIETARFIAENQANAKVACYHSQDFLIQRFLKERTLDCLLQRSNGNTNIERDAEINNILRLSEHDEILFIVVATPVEEIGRDHDFDWAVIEPSSTRSIVQTSGRVNRHRHVAVSSPNIAILQFNHRWARGENSVFCKPGFEIDAYDSHDLAELLNWDDLSAIDAGLMFKQHRFADFDNAAINKILEDPLDRLFNLEIKKPWWITQALYEDFPLREQETRNDFYLDEEERFHLHYLNSDGKPDWLERNDSVKPLKPVANDWLSWNNRELFEHCVALGLSLPEGMRVSVRKEKTTYDMSFGFY
jgi:CRISPR-associated endonuclease/helicase Cas3